MSNPYIPRDVVIEILVRLPVESIIRFRCISKSWNSLISSASIISAQTHLARKTTTLLLGDWDNRTLKFDDQPIGEYKKLGIPQIGPGVQVNGSCRGLICLTGEHPNGTTILWNPALRISLQLPKFSLKTPGYYFPCAVGFGFDVKRNDYKVIRIPYLCSDVPKQYEVFVLSQNAWKIVTPNKFPPDLYEYDSAPVYLNGSTHWISELATIVAFDFVDEAFLEMNVPGALKDRGSIKIAVKENQYLLAIHCYYYPNQDNGAMCIWMMEEYGVEESWSKLFIIHEPVMGIPLQLIYLRTNGEFLVRTGDYILVWYDCSTNTETCVGDSCLEFAIEYTETLALLHAPGTSEIKYKKLSLKLHN